MLEISVISLRIRNNPVNIATVSFFVKMFDEDDSSTAT